MHNKFVSKYLRLALAIRAEARISHYRNSLFRIHHSWHRQLAKLEKRKVSNDEEVYKIIVETRSWGIANDEIAEYRAEVREFEMEILENPKCDARVLPFVPLLDNEDDGMTMLATHR